MSDDKYQQELFERYSEQLGYRDFEEGEPDYDGRARYRNPNTQGRWNFWVASRDALPTPLAVMPAAPSDAEIAALVEAHGHATMPYIISRLRRAFARATLSQTMQAEPAAGEQAGAVADDSVARLNGAVAGLHAAVIFLDQMRKAAKDGEDVTGTGAARDAREWLESAARVLLDTLSAPPAAPGAAIAAREQEPIGTRRDWEKVQSFAKKIMTLMDSEECSLSSVSGYAHDAGERASWIERLAREALASREQEVDEATAMKGGRWVSADDIEHMTGELLSLATGDPYTPTKMVDAFHTLRTALAQPATVQRAEPAPASDTADAARWRFAMNWGTKDFAVCCRDENAWVPIKTNGPIDTAIEIAQTTALPGGNGEGES